MTRWAKLILIACGVVIIGVLMLWHFVYAPRLLWNATYTLHLMPLEDAVIRFSSEYKRLPTGIAEMLDACILPKRSKLYYCPLKHDSFFAKELDVSVAEIDFIFNPDEVVIKVPDTLYSEKRQSARFKWLLDGSLKRRIPRDTKLDPYQPNQSVTNRLNSPRHQ